MCIFRCGSTSPTLFSDEHEIRSRLIASPSSKTEVGIPVLHLTSHLSGATPVSTRWFIIWQWLPLKVLETCLYLSSTIEIPNWFPITIITRVLECALWSSWNYKCSLTLFFFLVVCKYLAISNLNDNVAIKCADHVMLLCW
jgi:hypothetical protein